MKIFFLLWLLLGIYYYSYSQVITITDMQTGQPLEMATLSSDDPKVFAVTNSQGQADISAFRDAERIEIRMLGYKMMTKSYAELGIYHFFITVFGNT